MAGSTFGVVSVNVNAKLMIHKDAQNVNWCFKKLVMLWNTSQKKLLPHNERNDDKRDILAEPGPQYVESQKDNIISYLLVCIWEKCKGKGGGGGGGGDDDDGDDDDDDVMRKYSFIVKDVPFGSSKISSYCMHLSARQRDSYSNQVRSIKFHKGMFMGILDKRYTHTEKQLLCTQLLENNE